MTQVVIPFKIQLKDLSLKLQTKVQPVFVSRKIGQDHSWLINSALCTNFNITCVMQVAVGYTHPLMAIIMRHLLCASIMIKATRVLSGTAPARLSSRPKDGQFSEMGDFRRPVLGGHLRTSVLNVTKQCL